MKSTLSKGVQVEAIGAAYVVDRLRCIMARTPWNESLADPADLPGDTMEELFTEYDRQVGAAMAEMTTRAAERMEGQAPAEIERILTEEFSQYTDSMEALTSQAFDEAMRRLIVQ